MSTEDVAGLVENPILNSPFFEPSRHFEFDHRGVITGEVQLGRRRSLYFTPIPGTNRRSGTQQALDVGDTNERVEENRLINQIRERVSVWRSGGYAGTTSTTRRLLEHWGEIDGRDRPLFFCQREAIETAVYLTEVAPKDHPYFTTTLAQYANAFNGGLYRLALKMATGTGKTVVMSLLITWQTINKAKLPHDSRFTDNFLVVAPGITIRDRLRVLMPSDPDNYYDRLDLVPASLRAELNRATVHVINYHQLMLREKHSSTAMTKRILGNESVFTETPGEMANRVLKPFSGSKQIVVLNDEGHHCYREKPVDVELDPEAKKTARGIDDLKGADKSEAKERDAAARVWHTGLTHLANKRGIKAVFDLSATPFYLRGSGWQEGTLFQWVVSDFALTDAIECGIVKIPRVPTRDDVDAADPAFRALWSQVSKNLPSGSASFRPSYPPVLPTDLEAALMSLYGDYEDHFERWAAAFGNDPNAVPPVFIVVAQNTNISRLIHEWMSGWEEEAPDGTTVRHSGNLPLFNNVDDDGDWKARPLAVIVDSKAIDSGDQLPKHFRTAAAAEIDRFRREFQLRNPGRDFEDIGEEGLLREVMNTVGTPGALGAPVRAVTSVSMLTEGWDANTVTHILGVRAFGTQLLCEQVVGRGLRRVSYELNGDGHFDPEYADVYGVPFAFVPTAGQRSTDAGVANHTFIHSIDSRAAARIEFPRVVGYRYLTDPDRITADFDDSHVLVLGDEAVPTQTEIEDITGLPETHTLDSLKQRRSQQIAYLIADLVVRDLNGNDGDARPWLFPQVLGLVRRWMDDHVELKGLAFPQLLGLSAHAEQAKNKIISAIAHDPGGGHGSILPILDRQNPTGHTGGIGWWTSKDPDDLWITNSRSHISHVVGHSDWEVKTAAALETMGDLVDRYVKNDHLDFTIPYVIDGIQKRYTPDFIAVVRDHDNNPLHLVIEVSGEDRRDKRQKVETTRERWIPAVNNLGELGRWDFIEISDPDAIAHQIRKHLGSKTDA